MKYHFYKDDGVLTECESCGETCPMTDYGPCCTNPDCETNK